MSESESGHLNAEEPTAKVIHILSSILEKYEVQWFDELVNAEFSIKSVSISSPTVVIDFPVNPYPITSVQEQRNGAQVFIDYLSDFFQWNPHLVGEYEINTVLNEWVSWRSDYLHNFQGLKKLESRREAIREIEFDNFGGAELSCTICGIIFYDNLEKHHGLLSLYCSRTCAESAVLQCMACDRIHPISKPFAYWKLSGFCSDECIDLYKSDRKYIYGMKSRAAVAGVEFDPSVTRRKVFEQESERCYLCGTQTIWSSDLNYEPNLATVDHLIPISKGGNHNWDNVRNCCMRCNIKKGDR